MILPLEQRAAVILDYAQRFGQKVFVETGSGDGYTAGRVAPHFERVFTIEISASKYYGVWSSLLHHRNVLPIHGDSEVVLPHLLSHLTEPAVFWLDAHYDGGDSGRGRTDTPIENELFTIFANRRRTPNVVLIDDARLFGTDPAYPELDWIESSLVFWSERFGWPPYEMTVADDIIRIMP